MCHCGKKYIYMKDIRQLCQPITVQSQTQERLTEFFFCVCVCVCVCVPNEIESRLTDFKLTSPVHSEIS